MAESPVKEMFPKEKLAEIDQLLELITQWREALEVPADWSTARFLEAMRCNEFSPAVSPFSDRAIQAQRWTAFVLRGLFLPITYMRHNPLTATANLVMLLYILVVMFFAPSLAQKQGYAHCKVRVEQGIPCQRS